MKKASILLLAASSGLLLVFAGSSMTVPNPEVKLEALSPHRTASGSSLMLADRIDTQDGVLLTTDPEMDRAAREQELHEKEKEEKAWQMLQNMNIYKKSGKQSGKSQGSDQSDGNSRN